MIRSVGHLHDLGIPLSGIPIVECPSMVGQKKAVRMNGTIYLSPAMMDLVRHTEGDELERLLAAIPLTELGDCKPWASRPE